MIKKWDKFNENNKSVDFKKEIYDIVEEYGGEERTDIPGYEMVLDTAYGLLFINAVDIVHRVIFMRFAFPQDAKDKVDCNPNSGKWNLWSSNYNDIVGEFRDRMEKVKGKSENPFEKLEEEDKVKSKKDDLPF